MNTQSSVNTTNTSDVHVEQMRKLRSRKGLTTQPDTHSPGPQSSLSQEPGPPEAAAACTLRSELWPGFSLALEWLSPQAGTKPVQPPQHPAGGYLLIAFLNHTEQEIATGLQTADKELQRLVWAGGWGCARVWLAQLCFVATLAVPSYFSAHSGPQASWGCHAQGRRVG